MALTDNIIAYYKLDESSGNASDSVASYTLTNVNTVTYGTGKINNGADFGSTNSDRLLGNASNLGVTGGAVSVSTWINITTQPSAGEQQAILRLSEDTNHTDVELMYVNTGGTYTLEFQRNKNGVGSNSVVRTGQLTASTWYHMVLTYNATTLRGYFNGTEVSNTPASGNGSGANPNYVTIGGHYNSALSYFYPFKGLTDEVGIWSRALTAGEVTSLYNAGSGIQYPFVTNYPITAGIGAFTLTGVDNSLLFGRSLSAGIGAFTLTGIDILFSLGKGIIAEVGSFILTGIDTALRFSGWTKVSKNTTNWTNRTKNTSSWTNITKH